MKLEKDLNKIDLSKFKKNPVVLEKHNMLKTPLGRFKEVEIDKKGIMRGVFIPRKDLSDKEKELFKAFGIEIGFIEGEEKNELLEVSFVKKIR